MDSKLIFLCLIALFPAVLATYYPYDCAGLCLNISQTCTGANLQYPNSSGITGVEFCETACLSLNTTNSTAWTDDTYDCRYYHAGVAATSLAAANVHCVHAGPLGGNYCGTLAEAYCDFVLQTCTGANAQYATAAFDMKTLCINSASGFRVANGGAIPAGWVGDATETSTAIECHQYHGLVANQSATLAGIHCPHAGPFGGSVCGSPVENFCSIVENSCGNTSYPSYANRANCVLLAAAFPAQTGPLGSEQGGNTIGCRAYHAAVAKTLPEQHCYHTSGNGGDGTCGSTCDAYCSIIQYGCTGANQQYANASACMAACTDYTVTNYYNSTNIITAAPSADTLECRYYHATAAVLVNANIHCPHAGPSGGGLCVSSGSSSGWWSSSYSGGWSTGASTGSNDAGSLKVTLGSFVAVVASVLLLL